MNKARLERESETNLSIFLNGETTLSLEIRKNLHENQNQTPLSSSPLVDRGSVRLGYCHPFQTVMATLTGVRLPCRHRAAIKFKLNPTPTNVTHGKSSYEQHGEALADGLQIRVRIEHNKIAGGNSRRLPSLMPVL